MHVLQRRKVLVARQKSLAAGVATFGAFALWAHVASGGAWLSNIRSSTGQPLTLTRFVQEMGGRFFVLGLPHGVAAWLAWRRKTSWLVLGPLLGSIAWTTFMMAKHGSGSHYWLEPTGLAVIAVVWMPSSESGAAPFSRWVLPSVLLYAALAAASSWPAYLAEPGRDRAHDAKVAALREHCVVAPGQCPSSRSDFRRGDGAQWAHFRSDVAIGVRRARASSCGKNGPTISPGPRSDGSPSRSIRGSRPARRTTSRLRSSSPFYDILKAPLFEHFDFDAEVGGMWVFRRKRTPG